MTINLEVVDKISEISVKKYTWKDCALYALGIGATHKDLEYLYEGTKGGMKVYPTFAITPIMGPLYSFFKEARINLAGALHAGHKITMHRMIKPQGSFYTVTHCKSIYDKGVAAVVNLEFETRDGNGDILFINQMTIFCRGQGNFGGDPGPKQLKFDYPEERPPVFTALYQIQERQAAIYRLSGDYNPLHIDPKLAEKAGFTKPVLHGLCTYGYVGRAVLHHLCRGDASILEELNAKFVSLVFPGDTLEVKGWGTDDPGMYIIAAKTQNGLVLDQSYLRIKHHEKCKLSAMSGSS